MECLITNEICPVGNKKCKECKLEDCKEVMKMIDIHEKKEKLRELTRLKEELPKECSNCSLLNIIDVKNKKVYCPYMIKRCILNETN